MLIGRGGPATATRPGGRGAGTILAFDFKTRSIEKLAPENVTLVPSNMREMAYVPEADLVLFGSVSCPGGGEERGGKQLTRVYDCAKNRYALLDAGPAAYGHSAGWMYDAKRGIAYVFTYRGEAWAMRIVAKELKLLDKPAAE